MALCKGGIKDISEYSIQLKKFIQIYPLSPLKPEADALLKALEEITRVQEGIDAGLSGDLMAIDIRQALYYFGEITGEITNDDLLGNIFANFCIGK